MASKKLVLPPDYIAGFVDGEGCFDLQFRKDVRHKRKNKPVYYSWAAQFVILARNDEIELFKAVKNTLKCGCIYFTKDNKVRYSVQDVNDLYYVIAPFFKKNHLFGKKKRDFELWAEAIKILYQHKKKKTNVKKGTKGFLKTDWNKKDFQRLVGIQKLMQKYKAKRPQGFKWISLAESIVKTL